MCLGDELIPALLLGKLPLLLPLALVVDQTAVLVPASETGPGTGDVLQQSQRTQDIASAQVAEQPSGMSNHTYCG